MCTAARRLARSAEGTRSGLGVHVCLHARACACVWRARAYMRASACMRAGDRPRAGCACQCAARRRLATALALLNINCNWKATPELCLLDGAVQRPAVAVPLGGVEVSELLRCSMHLHAAARIYKFRARSCMIPTRARALHAGRLTRAPVAARR